MLAQILSPADADRASRTFRKLARHDLSTWALTGGIATEIHCLQQGGKPLLRDLNDIDFIAESFDCIPHTLAEDFLFRHAHPSDPPGKTMAQFVDPDSLLRIDVFRPLGETMRRVSTLSGLLPMPVQLISLEDLLARGARLALDLIRNVPTPSKYARDFLRLAALIAPAKVERAWLDQRRSSDPETFAEAYHLLQSLIPASQHLLIAPEFSKDPSTVCSRCRSDGAFVPAEPKVMLALFGYC